jgi:hypothetical protein
MILTGDHPQDTPGEPTTSAPDQTVTDDDTVKISQITNRNGDSVTTNGCGPGGPDANRNDTKAARLAELTAQVAEDRQEHPERIPWYRRKATDRTIALERFESLAHWDARWCEQCGLTLGADEPVWRLRWSHPLRTLCEACVAWYHAEPRGYYDEPRRYRAECCPQCSRLVYRSRWDYRGRPFCCEACRHRFDAAERREARADARADLRCEVCGEAIKADRSDARYCKSACRQKAYRDRKRSEPTL